MMQNRSWPSVCPELIAQTIDLEQVADDVRASAFKAGIGFHQWGLVRVLRMDDEFRKANKDETLVWKHVEEISSTLKKARALQHRESLMCDKLLEEEMEAACKNHSEYRHELIFLIVDAFSGNSLTQFCQLNFPAVANEFTAGMARHQQMMLLMESLFQFDSLVQLEQAIRRERPEMHQKRESRLNVLRGQPLDQFATFESKNLHGNAGLPTS